MEISIVIPTYHEKNHIKLLIPAIFAILRKNKISGEIVVVDDSETDDTYLALRDLKKKYKYISIIWRRSKKGFGSAIIQGIQQSKGNIVMIMMGDFCDDPKKIPIFVKKIRDGYDMVFGSRFIKGGAVIDYPLSKLILNRTCNFMAYLFLRKKVTDITNSFKAYKRNILKEVNPKSNYFDISEEIAIGLIKKGYKFYETPVSWKNRKFGKSKFKYFDSIIPYLRTLLRCL